MISDCNLIAKKNNFDFKWNSKFPINSLNIMRGCFDINLSNRDPYIETLFDAYWRDDLDHPSNKHQIMFQYTDLYLIS